MAKMDQLLSIVDDLSYIKGKLDSTEDLNKAHREWQRNALSAMQETLNHQNGRIRKNEVTIGWFRGITLFFSGVVAWIVSKV